MAILLSKNIAQCDDRARRPRTRRDDRAAVGWAWTGRNLILDEALAGYCLKSSFNKTILRNVEGEYGVAVFGSGYFSSFYVTKNVRSNIV